jgi:hypothetical protein
VQKRNKVLRKKNSASLKKRVRAAVSPANTDNEQQRQLQQLREDNMYGRELSCVAGKRNNSLSLKKNKKRKRADVAADFTTRKRK